MSDDFFLPFDWPAHDSPARAAGASHAADDGSPFSAALANLFNAASRAGEPPPYLREVLATEHWSPMTLPEPAQCAVAAARTRAYVGAAETRATSSGKKKKYIRPPHAANARNALAYRVSPADAPQADAVSARQVLQQLPERIAFVVLQFADLLYSFNRQQCRALLGHYQSLAMQREAAQREQRDLQLLAGSGGLEEFLAMTVRVDKNLKSSCTAEGEVLLLQTLGFDRYSVDTVELRLHALVHELATRQDFDGVRFNRRYAGDSAFDFGPNFAAFCLRGRDPRHAGPCPAAAIGEIEFGLYLTRRFARVDERQKQMIAQRLDQARQLLSAIAPGESALPRAALISLEGARSLRRYPQVAERQWLQQFIARGERALRTRWRIGVF